ncbi:hypothetical protein BGZ94_007521, partial [Podila epigama]
MADSTTPSSATPTPSTSSTDPITLRIRTLDPQILSVTVTVQETVLQLKERLAQMLQVPSPRQRLIFQGRMLRDEDRLDNYALQDGHTLHLVTRPADVPANPRNDAPPTNANNASGSGSNTGRRPVDYQFHIIDGRDTHMAFGTTVVQAPGAAGRTRSSTHRRGQGLPHLESIRAEMRRVSAQLRNVETILRRSENE